ncbi:MAG: hypothetical protein IKC12_05085 [Alistipes sp.]|nr:hypothetical protein [Alistipes sp.]
MKPYKYKHRLLGEEIINPIIPRMDVFDGIGSLFNLTGTYYPINSMIEEVCDASRHISSVSTAWSKISEDMNKSVVDFASINKLPRPTSLIKYPTLKFDIKPWEIR